MQITCNWKVALAFLATAIPVPAAEPYFVTYSHHMEEPGNLEIATNEVVATPTGGNTFLSTLVEMEYGVKAWWTTELYLSTQRTFGQGSAFTGYRLENRLRPLMREHWINPVLYFEYFDGNEADRSLREIAGHDTAEDLAEPLSEQRLEREREIEGKLILSSYVHNWNISENFIAEKVLNHPDSWEFGYAIAASRPLGTKATPYACRFCAENFWAGVEMYGGLGDRHSFGLHDTSHYIAPTIAWALPSGTTFKFSPGFGLNGNSNDFLLRFTVAHEINQFGRLFRRSK
jgi:hypothetical protein